MSKDRSKSHKGRKLEGKPFIFMNFFRKIFINPFFSPTQSIIRKNQSWVKK